MSYFILTLIFFLIAIAFLYGTFKLLYRQSWFVAWLRGMSGVSLILLALLCGLLAFDVYSYRQITGEKNVATVSFSQLEGQYYTVTLSFTEGGTQRYDVYGDQWQIDSRIIKWNKLLTLVGLETGFRLDRLNGRYLSLDDERNKPRTVHEISRSATPVDFWEALNALNIDSFVDARYGSSTYLPMVDGGQYQINITTTGLLARPLNETARQAVARWE